MTHKPAGDDSETTPVEALTEQPDVELLSRVYVTALPDPPPVADTVYVEPTRGEVGGEFVNVIDWGTGVIEPLSVDVAGAASDELAFAEFVNGPVVEDAVAVIVIGGNVVPVLIGVAPVYEHDTNCPVIGAQLQSVPDAAVGVNDAGSVSLTTTV
jgi:hypothetical protein